MPEANHSRKMTERATPSQRWTKMSERLSSAVGRTTDDSFFYEKRRGPGGQAASPQDWARPRTAAILGEGGGSVTEDFLKFHSG